MRRIIIYSGLFALLLLATEGCRFSGRVINNKEDMRQAQEVAERYFTSLRDQQFDSAVALFGESVNPKPTAQSLKDDLDGRFAGGAIQSWQLKEGKIIQESPRRILLLYQVQSTSLARDFEIATEMLPNPWRWKLVGVTIANDQTAIANAKEAQPTADLFLKHLHDGSFERAYKLLSQAGQRKNTLSELRSFWLRLEEDGGGITGWEMKQFYDTTMLVEGKRRPYTMLGYMIHSSKGYIAGLMSMVKDGDNWQVEGLQLRNDITF